MTTGAEIQIARGLPEASRLEAADIFFDAFRRKMALLVCDPLRGAALFSAIMDPACAIAALEGSRCVGLAGIQYGDRFFLRPAARPFIKHAGWIRGLPGYIIFHFLIDRLRDSEMRIAYLAVQDAHRGQGIGARLLTAAEEWARDLGLRTLSLEVVDTNPRARALYERMGFRVIRTMRYPYLRHVAGFSASTLMEKTVASEGGG